MKRLLIPLVILTLFSLILVACGSPSTTAPTTSAPTTTAPTSIAPTQAATKPPTTTTSLPVTAAPPTTTSAETPQYGGTLRIIATGSPQNIGYSPDQSFADHTPGPLWSDRLMWLATNGDLVPNLAESWQTAPDGLSITLKIRKGVKFHDGTDLNAAAVKWNMDRCKQTGALPGAGNFTSIDLIDDYTVKFSMKEKNILAAYNIARPFIYSPTATEKNGKEWAYTHTVSTAAFKVTEFTRDVGLKLVKNPDYWRPNRPYLDAIEFKIVKEPAACAAMIQAGQADVWFQGTLQESADLRDKGYQVITGPNVINNLYGDSVNPGSPFAKKAVREAVEYALDRPAMAKALGYGFAEPINQMTPKGTAGYNPDYVGRPYDPVKAKLLLGGAGYPEGFKTKLMCLSTAQNTAQVVQGYLKVIGIEAEIDIADTGRYWGSIFATGWNGLLLGVSALNPEYAVVYLDHFGPYPVVKFVSLGKSDAFIKTCMDLYVSPDIASMRKATQKVVTQASEDAMAIPMYYSVMTTPMQKNIRSTFQTALDWTNWSVWEDWISAKK